VSHPSPGIYRSPDRSPSPALKRAIFYRLLASAVLLATAALLASDLVGWWHVWIG
jgi:hypothetical protein